MSDTTPSKVNKKGAWIGAIVLFVGVCWIADMAGCNSDSVSPAFDAGYRLGLAAGKTDGAPGRTPPAQSELENAARGALKGSEYANASGTEQEKYKDGFKSGYEVGFKEASKPAF